MKLTLIGPVYPYRGGIAHFTTVLAKKLGEAGHDVQVISFKKQYPTWLYPGESDKDFSEGRDKVDAKYLLTPMNPLSWQKTIKTIVDFQPERVIIPWWVTFWGPAFHYLISHLKQKEISTTILIHNTIPHEANPIDRQIARWTLRTATCFIVMTPKEKERLLTLLPGITNIYISPHPILQQFKSTQMDKLELRRKFNLKMDHSVILFFGFVRPYKGLSDLLEAQKILLSKGYKILLIIVGEFWESLKSYEQKIKRLGLESHVKIINKYIPDKEVAQYFELADLFVAPYKKGTQSGVVKTALSFGLPIITTEAIADDILRSISDRCKIVSIGNPTELANSIASHIFLPKQNPSEVQDLINHSWENFISIIANNANP